MGDYIQAVLDRNLAENISRVLYPNDNVGLVFCPEAHVVVISRKRSLVLKSRSLLSLRSLCSVVLRRKRTPAEAGVLCRGGHTPRHHPPLQDHQEGRPRQNLLRELPGKSKLPNSVIYRWKRKAKELRCWQLTAKQQNNRPSSRTTVSPVCVTSIRTRQLFHCRISCLSGRHPAERHSPSHGHPRADEDLCGHRETRLGHCEWESDPVDPSNILAS